MSAESKTNRFKRPVRALGSLAAPAAVQAAVSNDLNVEMIALHQIQPDPHNRRSLGLDPISPKTIDPNDPEYARKSEDLARIEELAQSIEKQGLLQPISVYPYGSGYRIVAGERRYLAHVLLGAPSVKALILSAKPRNLRTLQLIENSQREGIPLDKQIESMRDVLLEYEANGEPITSGDEFALAIGRRRTTAYRWWALVHASEDVLEAVRNGLIGFVDASNLATISSAEERSNALAAMLSGESTDAATALPVAVAKPTEKRGRGRPALIKATLGSTTNLGVVRRIVAAVEGEDACADTNWSDPKAVTARFKKLLQELERTHG